MLISGGTPRESGARTMPPARRPDRKRPSVAVCVPVRDERRHLTTLVAALAGQQSLASPFALCLAFDGAQPDSQATVQAMSVDAPFTLHCTTIERHDTPNAGRVRRAAMGLGVECVGRGQDARLLTTDADSAPAPDWIVRALAALSRVDVVAGRIQRRQPHRLGPRYRLENYLDRLYRLERQVDPIDYEPTGAYPGIGGANLGCRAPVYLALGGFAASSCDEDTNFVQAARQAGYRVARDPSVRVATSSRRQGRARGGLADALRDSVDVDTMQVEHPADALARYQRQALARRAFDARRSSGAMAMLASRLSLPVARVQRVADDAASADAFSLALAADRPARQVVLSEAERLLDAIEFDHRALQTATAP
ncbi:glycosyl transferase family 2 [Salinisphaera sp. T31B1]|uniref:glycosyltransferase n=1 Tax=Salinisphaera sp. T31B1 TaxID=727963 RepID=UPI003341D100